MSLRADFWTFDDLLASKGVPPLTGWWRTGIGDWLDAYAGAHTPELIACAGRGSSKSVALYKLATYFTVFVPFEIPVAERHYAIVLSRLKEEAGKGVDIIGGWLRLIGVPHSVAGDVIEVESLRQHRGIRVVAASVAASSGWRAYFVGKDERSKWPASGLEETDAAEIDSSAAAMTATHPRAALVTVGSAWGAFGAFFDAVMAGSDDGRTVLGPAATWVAAPHLREADCRRKERDPRRFAREYECVFQAGAAAAFPSDQIDRAFRSAVPGDWDQCGRVVLCDPSGGGSDAWAWCVCGWRRQPGGGASVLEITAVDGIADAARDGLTSDAIVGKVAATARRHEVRTAHADQYSQSALSSAFSRLGLTYVSHAWTSPLKERATEHVRGWLRDGLIALPNHDRLRSELLSFEERISPSGALTFRGRGNTHDDFAMLILLAAAVDIEAGLKGSPSGGVLPGQGWVDYMAQEYLSAGGGPSQPLVVVPAEPELISLALPPKMVGCSQFISRSGTVFRPENGMIKVASDHVDLEEMISKQGFVPS